MIPLLSIAAGFFLVKQAGKREFLKFDLVQFVYGFVLAPLMFIWLKVFIFMYIKRVLESQFDPVDAFVLDSAFSVIFMFVFAFLIIHSLTKSFELRKKKERFYDIFEHAEYFHLFLTHTGFWGGSMILMVFLALLNLFVPFKGVPDLIIHVVTVLGIISGILGYLAVVKLSFLHQYNEHYLNRLKLLVGVLFLVLIYSYVVFSADYDQAYSLYWYVFFTFVSLIFIFFFVNERAKKLSTLKRLARKFLGK